MKADAYANRAAVATSARALDVRSAPFRSIASVGGDVLAAGGLVFSIPFVILGIMIPIALFVQLLFWIGRSL